jgi:hypothetical protein
MERAHADILDPNALVSPSQFHGVRHGSSVPIEHHHTKGSLIIARESGEYRYFNRAACTRFND